MSADDQLKDSLPPGARRMPLYRLTIWWLRLFPVAIVLAMVFLVAGGWVLALCYIVVGLLVTLPMRYIAHTDWGLKQSEFDALVLGDAVDLRFW
ncbi:hypothetical protein [Micromonospora sp. WMMD1082]|uniref:hypothetical protein n=1 Tax=Micromonospora sp. WMMD1082 TaxID=3016104 RepID=UPI002415D4EA|nr:hypothetical protein [Micromonospora sp. WMMD1082]MDG4796720.1 hypothetical protein [Micromonospora sp. WMMD1082]